MLIMKANRDTAEVVYTQIYETEIEKINKNN
jgi:hypothetical protein